MCFFLFLILLSKALIKNILLELCLHLGYYMSDDYFSISRLVFSNKIGKTSVIVLIKINSVLIELCDKTYLEVFNIY